MGRSVMINVLPDVIHFARSGKVVLQPKSAHKERVGIGYLAGEYPGGTTTVDGVPSVAVVRVLLRTVQGHPGDGYVVAEATSNPDGTWRVDGLNPSLRYDVVGRKDGYNDVIVANVQPEVD